MSLTIRPAVRTDAAQILAFITELAEYERARHEVVATVADIEHSLFDEGSTVHSLICERDGVAIGFAVYFYSYSTWLGRNGIYRRPLHHARTTRRRRRAASFAAHCPRSRGQRLRAYGVERAGLERASHRFLQVPRRRASG